MDAFGIEVLQEAGPLASFALYLIISQRKQQERSDATISELRTRYDQVVMKQDATIDQLTLQIGTKIDRLLDKVGIAPPPPPPPPAPSATITIDRKVAKAVEAALDKQGKDEP